MKIERQVCSAESIWALPKPKMTAIEIARYMDRERGTGRGTAFLCTN